MSEDITRFCAALEDLIKSFEQRKLALRMSADIEHGIVRVYAEGSGAVARARAGLDEVAELAYDTAEHHPYWNLLYDGSQILRIVLERWNEDLTDDDLKEMDWLAGKMRDSIANVVRDSHH